ncbi:MAG TPA: response regulator transcription factor [Gemmatimonadales bacterium]|jgi:DNA-binding NarL/FixJ family response regulator|nr:response regulator transcription factor [Gemmatimonadales bacterium]
MSEPPIRVLVADDHAIVRTGIRHVLEGEPGFEVVAEASTGTEAVALALALRPDVAVLDISMPGLTGIQAAAELRRGSPETRVLILSMHDNTEYVLESLRAGVHGYLLKDGAAAELGDAIRAVCRGESFFSPPVAYRLGAVVRGEVGGGAAEVLAQLTARERQVLVGVARGQTNKQMAQELGISHRTVESHRESLMRKLGVYTVAGLTRIALEERLLP